MFFVQKICLVAVLLPWLSWGDSIPASPVRVDFYSQPGCKVCERIKKITLPALHDRFRDRISVTEFDTSKQENLMRLLDGLATLNDRSNHSVYMIVDQAVALGGPGIEERIFDTVESRLQRGRSMASPLSDGGAARARAEKFSIGVIALAGLIDGINPCVFATLIFFVSLLSATRVDRSKLLAIGVIYMIACFFTYFSLGFGLFYALRMLSWLSWLRNAVDYLLMLTLLGFAVVSFGDAWRYRRGNGKDGVWLKLPEPVMRRMHRIMRAGLSYKVLVPGIFFTGMMVTILESVCTGQVYVPTLVLMAREHANLQWLLLLLLYNLMFILPLVFIFIVVYRGATALWLVELSKRHMVFAKVAMGMFFIAMLLAMLLLH